VVFAFALVGLVTTYVGLVATEAGQSVENLAVRGAELRSDADHAAGLERLSVVSVVSFAIAIGAVLVVGAARRRLALGVALGALMGLSVVAAEALKGVLARPALVEGPTWLLRNTFPSGSATVAVAIAIGAGLICAERLRWLSVAAGALYAAVIADAVQTTGWHRLSDTIGGALLVIATVSAGVGLLARAGFMPRTAHGRIDRRLRGALLVGTIVVTGLALAILLIAAMFPLLTSPDGGRRVFLQTAFPLLGAGIVGTLVIAFAWVVEPYGLGPRQNGGRAMGGPSHRGDPRT
jgi:hypothetical protein